MSGRVYPDGMSERVRTATARTRRGIFDLERQWHEERQTYERGRLLYAESCQRYEKAWPHASSLSLDHPAPPELPPRPGLSSLEFTKNALISQQKIYDEESLLEGSLNLNPLTLLQQIHTSFDHSRLVRPGRPLYRGFVFIGFDDTIFNLQRFSTYSHISLGLSSPLLPAFAEFYNGVSLEHWRSALMSLREKGFFIVLLTNRVPVCDEDEAIHKVLDIDLRGLFDCELFTSGLVNKGLLINFIHDYIHEHTKIVYTQEKFFLVDDNPVHIEFAKSFCFSTIKSFALIKALPSISFVSALEALPVLPLPFRIPSADEMHTETSLFHQLKRRTLDDLVSELFRVAGPAEVRDGELYFPLCGTLTLVVFEKLTELESSNPEEARLIKEDYKKFSEAVRTGFRGNIHHLRMRREAEQARLRKMEEKFSQFGQQRARELAALQERKKKLFDASCAAQCFDFDFVEGEVPWSPTDHRGRITAAGAPPVVTRFVSAVRSALRR